MDLALEHRFTEALTASFNWLLKLAEVGNPRQGVFVTSRITNLYLTIPAAWILTSSRDSLPLHDESHILR